MQIRITPMTKDLLPATRAFNQRLKPASTFMLPETLPIFRTAEASDAPAISWTHYLAMDDSEARGGFLLMDQPAWVNGGVCRANNYQSILSEGIRDRRYGFVSVHMLKYIERTARYAFTVGMGDAQNPLPRLLKASGWTLRAIPFLFCVQNVRNFLREVRPFRQNRYCKTVAKAAFISGVGWLGVRLLQARALVGRGSSKGLNLDSISSWGSWADELWEKFRSQCCFAVVRDRSTLNLLYPLANERLKAFLVSNGSAPIGWATLLDTPMRDDKYFGNLRVVTILDCVAVPELIDAFVRRITIHLEKSGADLVITNQSHFLWTAAFRNTGFLSAASNYFLATSKQLSAAILAGGGEERVHLTRGDGDGRIHL
jgi:hypothetical protein